MNGAVAEVDQLLGMTGGERSLGSFRRIMPVVGGRNRVATFQWIYQARTIHHAGESTIAFLLVLAIPAGSSGSHTSNPISESRVGLLTPRTSHRAGTSTVTGPHDNVVHRCRAGFHACADTIVA